LTINNGDELIEETRSTEIDGNLIKNETIA